MATQGTRDTRHRVSPQARRRATTATAAAQTLTLADYDIEWNGTVYDGRSLVPVLRLGGARALWEQLTGLCNLLHEHEVLDEAELVFVRTWLRELAEHVYAGDVDDERGAAGNCKLVLRQKGGA